MKVIIGSDHAGVEYKRAIVAALTNQSYEVEDVGPFNSDSVDYPDFAHIVSQRVASTPSLGILLCGSGNGVCMSANKHQTIRAALAWSVEIARLARQHNDANVLCVPARFVSEELALQMVKVFLNEPFEGGRHQRRVEKICM